MSNFSLLWNKLRNRQKSVDTIKVFFCTQVIHDRETSFLLCALLCVFFSAVFLNSNAEGILSSSLSRRKLFFNILERLLCRYKVEEGVWEERGTQVELFLLA